MVKKTALRTFEQRFVGRKSKKTHTHKKYKRVKTRRHVNVMEETVEMEAEIGSQERNRDRDGTCQQEQDWTRATKSFSTKAVQCLQSQPLDYPEPVYEVEYRIPMSKMQFSKCVEQLQGLVGPGTRRQDTVLQFIVKNGPMRFCLDGDGNKLYCGTKQLLLVEELSTKTIGTVLTKVVGVCSVETDQQDADLDQSATAWFRRDQEPPGVVPQSVKTGWDSVSSTTVSMKDVERVWPHLQFVSSGKKTDKSLISLPCRACGKHYAFGAVVANLKSGAVLTKVHHGEKPRITPVGVKQRDRTTFKFDSRITVDCTAFRLNSGPELYNVEIEFAGGSDYVVPGKLQFLFDNM